MNKAFKAMTKARIGLIKLQPFFGVLSVNLKLVENTALKPPTLATDGRTLYYHPDWVEANDPVVIEAGVAHEVGHCALSHMSRRGARSPKRWNHAIDYAVNEMLADCGFTIPPTWLHSPAFKGMSAEEIYNLLPPDDDTDGDEPFDGHQDLADDPSIQTTWEIAVIQAAHSQRAADEGRLPGTLQRFLDELHAPKVDWRDILRRFAGTACKDDFSWARPNRAYLSLGIILPGLYSERVEDITTIIDTSGSIDDAILTAFGSEIADIRVSVRPQMLRSMYCDADVNHVDEFEEHDEFKVTGYGGGGTDFRPPFKWLADRDLTPTCAVYLTDGYGAFPTAPPPYPVLWVMTTDVQPPWGEVVRIEV